MKRLPDYKKMSEEELDKQLELYGAYYGVELYPEEYENGYYFRDVKTDVLVGYFEYDELFNRYFEFRHAFGAQDSIKVVKESNSLLMSRFRGEKSSLSNRFALITGCVVAVSIIAIVGAFKIGKNVGSEQVKEQLVQQYDIDYNLPATYSLNDAPLELLVEWANFSYGEWSDGKIDSEHYRLVEKAQSMYDGPFCEVMRAYYSYLDMKEEANYLPNVKDALPEQEQYVRFLASQLELEMDGCIPFRNSPYAYVTNFQVLGYDEYTYDVRLDEANDHLLNEKVTANDILPEGVFIGEDRAMYISIERIRELNANNKTLSLN